MDDCTQAMEWSERALALNEDLPYYLNTLADCQRKIGQYALALANVERVILLDPAAPQGYNTRGNIYYDQGRYEAALQDYERAVDLSLEMGQEMPVLYVNLGNAHQQLGNLDEAIRAYSRAIILAPRSIEVANAYLVLGDIYAYRQDYRQAAQYYQTYIEIVPPEQISTDVEARIQRVLDRVN